MDLLSSTSDKLRATISSPLHFGRSRQSPAVQKRQILKDHMGTSTSESTSNYFFIRVSPENLQEQKRIYKWRMNCSDKIVGVKSIKLQAEGNKYNPNSLFKVEIEISKSNFTQMRDLSLCKIIKIVRTAFQSLDYLLQYFDPVFFTQKMIYVTQEFDAKVWVDERYYANPNNQLYTKNIQDISIEKSILSLINIFEKKCLSTKQSLKFFSALKQYQNVQSIIEFAAKYEEQQSLFSIQKMKNSISASLVRSKTNQKQGIQFQKIHTPRKRKQRGKAVKQENLFLSRKFNEFKSMRLPSQKIISLKISSDHIYKSKNEIKQPNQNNPEKEKRNQFESIVNSEIMKDDNSSSLMTKAEQRPRKQRINFSSAIQSQLQKNNYQLSLSPDNSFRKISASHCEQTEEQRRIRNKIIQQNGWNKQIGSLFEKPNLKQSFTEGKQERSPFTYFRLEKLHMMGKQVQQVQIDHEEH